MFFKFINKCQKEILMCVPPTMTFCNCLNFPYIIEIKNEPPLIKLRLFRFWLFFVLKLINSSQFHYYIIIRMCRYLLVTWGVYFTVAFSQYSQQTISILLVYTLLNITKLHNICSISNTSNIYRLDALSYYIQHSTIFFSMRVA